MASLPSTSTLGSAPSEPDVSLRRTTTSHIEDGSKSSEVMSSTYDVVVDLLNNAAVMQKGADKIVNLRKVQELIVNKSPDLLDNFMDEMLAFQTDISKEVKKFIIAFMEDACKKDHECLPKVLPSMIMLLSDDDVGVQKKVVLTMSNMFKVTLTWISKAKKTRPEMTEVWVHLEELKNQLFDMLESVNDGIRTHVVKFLEGLTLILSRRTPESEIPKNQDKEFSIDQMPETNGVVSVDKLEDEGNKAFMTLLQFQGSPHVSSINLMTVMNALSNIGKQRPQYFDQVVQSFEALHVNLPPTLAKSQVSSVRKNLKNQLLSLLRHPSSFELSHQVTTLLTDLGASQSEIAKSMPKDVDRKRKAPSEPTGSSNSYAKKSKIEIDDEDDGITPWVDRSKKQKSDPVQKQTAIDVTADDLLPRLTPQNVSDLVLLSMVMLPETMPAQFQSTYTPIAAAGTESQISHIARLLATQLTMAGMGKGLGELQMQALKESASDKMDTDEQPSSPKQIIQTVVGLKTDEPEMKKPKLPQMPQLPSARKIKQFQLSSVTKPLKRGTMDSLLSQAMTRLIQAEKVAASSHKESHRMKMLACLTTLSGEPLREALNEYIFQDVRGRQDLAFAWLYQEYAHSHGYSANRVMSSSLNHGRYDECLTRLFVGLMQMEDHHADNFFHRLIQEAPVLTDNTMAIIRRYCADSAHTSSGMVLLTQLINNRPAHRLQFLHLMLSFLTYDDPEVRNVSINAAKSLHSSGLMQDAIEKYASGRLKMLLSPKPLAASSLKEEESWTEENIKAHLYLHLELLPANHKLIHELANIYTATTADIKRTILRVLEVPVRGMGMDSPELLTLVENCPKGSETLVMRVIHILTDKAVPSPELVDRIRDLYHKRVPDVRFLIPVLNGLSKAEVIEALPKLIRLNPHVVKEVFNRLMGSHMTNDAVYHSPLTPVELLVALHNIDPSKCDMKTIIKAANMCFNERNVYTQETVAIVMQKLMEIDPLPTLLMRTVIQSMSTYPRLLGFVLNILQRLIVKKVWKQKKVWEGFIRCCQRAKPQSFQVLLTLPAAQLKDVFELCPDLRQPLIENVQSFTDHQRAHVNPSVLAFLEQSEEKVINVDQNAEESALPKSNGEMQNLKEVQEVQGENIQPIGSVTDSSTQKISTISSVLKPLTSSSRSPPLEGRKEQMNSPVPDASVLKEEEKESKEKEEAARDKSEERDKRDKDREDRDKKSSKNSKRDSPENDDRDAKSKSSSKTSSSSSSKSSSQTRRPASSRKK